MPFRTLLSFQDRKLTWKNIFIFLFCFLILFIFYLIPNPAGLEYGGKMMIGVLITAAILWITEPIPLAVTGLFIMILQPLLFIMSAEEVFTSFGNQAVFFLIGAFIIAGAIEKHGLHRRLALGFLKRFENSPRSFTFGIMISCAFLSFLRAMPDLHTHDGGLFKHKEARVVNAQSRLLQVDVNEHSSAQIDGLFVRLTAVDGDSDRDVLVGRRAGREHFCSL